MFIYVLMFEGVFFSVLKVQSYVFNVKLGNAHIQTNKRSCMYVCMYIVGEGLIQP
jgi:hypothetical protein